MASPQGPVYRAVMWPRGSNTVLSVQPDGSLQTRPKANIGPWESGRLFGDKLVFDDSAYPSPYAFTVINGL